MSGDNPELEIESFASAQDGNGSFPVFGTDQKVQSAFDNILSPIWKQRRNNSDESQTLAQLRDLLLPKLITGEIRVKDAERWVEEKV